jgi:hypothetical protein
MAELFRIADLEIFAVGEGQCVVRPRGGSPHVLPERDARLLASCTDYQPLEAHAQAWAAFLERQKLERASRQGPRWLSRVLDAGAAFAHSGLLAAR